jgi:hypothetical protein
LYLLTFARFYQVTVCTDFNHLINNIVTRSKDRVGPAWQGGFWALGVSGVPTVPLEAGLAPGVSILVIQDTDCIIPVKSNM